MNLARKVTNVFKRISQNVDVRLQNSHAKEIQSEQKGIVVLDTALNSDNLGDEIIMHYIKKQLAGVLDLDEAIHIATHEKPTEEEIQQLLSAEHVIVCGTNILSPQMELYSGWRFDNRLIRLRNLIFVSVGWWGYKNPSIYSKYVYRTLFAGNVLHSARDDQTVEKLNQIGISNVLNTNCLTMWGLDEVCKEVPCHKTNKVIFTITGVVPDPDNDKKMISILRNHYDEIYFWPQGQIDLEYFRKLGEDHGITVLDRTLDAYTKFLETNDADYIGSRLHGGIHALHHKKRSIIIAVDNRAVEMAKHSNLPVIKNTDIQQKLESLIVSDWDTKISLNKENIAAWLSSFQKLLA